ncbi:MAG: NAD-dependent epimerase/dehydratase family protein, partial [Planctomycetota bacterium JB042]
YGFAPRTPVAEEDVPRRIVGASPRLSYPRAKLALDRAARAAAAAGARVLVVRPFNLVGARQDGDGGAVLPRFCARARAGLPLEVHGSGAQRRVFLDVRDAARMLADLALREAWPVDAVNLGGTEEWSVAALARRVVDRLGAPVTVRHVAPPPTRGGVEVERRVPDLSRLRALVDARPRRTVDDAILALAESLGGVPAERVA